MENIKRAILIAVICLIPFVCHAVKMTDFTEDTSPTSDDLIWTTNAPATAPADRKVTLGNLLLWMATQDWTFSGTVTLPVITLADASTLTLPAAAPTAEGLPITCNNSDSTCSFATGFSSITIGGGTASTVAVWDGSQNLSSLTSQNMVTTGQVDGRVKVVVATDTVTIDASASNQTVFYINGANSARTFNLPAAVAGLAYCFSNALYAQALTVNPAAGDKIILAGVAADAGEYVESTSAAATDKICVLAIDTEYWLVTASTGTWAQDTP